MTLAMMTELEGADIKVNLVSPGFASTALVAFQGTFTRWEGVDIPW